MPDGICRVYLSREHQRANERVAEWMRAVGMDTWVDAAGSVCGRYAGEQENAKTLVIGSHLDTIPDAGRYDGILGVLLGIEVVGALHAASRRLPFAIEVIGFAEEEGVRFGATLMASRAFAGTWDSDWWALADADGIDLRSAFAEFGLSAEQITQARRDAGSLLGYLEVHIEQGPVLESLDAPLGVVTAIAGARRAQISITGLAGHAGTTPMNLRRDALVAAAQGIALLEALAVEYGVVATVGQIECEPGGVNVIPGFVTFSIDVRAADDGLRDRVVAMFETQLQSLCEARSLALQVTPLHAAAAVACAPQLQQAFAAAVTQLGLSPHELPSGAGHDAMAVADVCPVGMLFLRCTDGISHNPAEAVTREDVAWSFAALERTVVNLAT